MRKNRLLIEGNLKPHRIAVHITSLALLLVSGTLRADAPQAAPDDAASATAEEQSIEVSGVRKPEWKSYRALPQASACKIALEVAGNGSLFRPPLRAAAGLGASPLRSSHKLERWKQEAVALAMDHRDAGPAPAAFGTEKRDDKYAAFDAAVTEAKVPNCLHKDGLKRQPPRIGFFVFQGELGLPFVHSQRYGANAFNAHEKPHTRRASGQS